MLLKGRGSGAVEYGSVVECDLRDDAVFTMPGVNNVRDGLLATHIHFSFLLPFAPVIGLQSLRPITMEFE